MNAGSSYRQLISAQLAEERDRKKSIEQRGTAVITTSSVLVSLLLGLASLRAQSTFDLPSTTRPLIGVALVAFIVAGLLAIGTNAPVGYREPTIDALRELTTPAQWIKSQETGEISAASVEVTILEAARKANGRKAWLLVGAITAEIIAVGLLAWALWLVLAQ